MQGRSSSARHRKARPGDRAEGRPGACGKITCCGSHELRPCCPPSCPLSLDPGSQRLQHTRTGPTPGSSPTHSPSRSLCTQEPEPASSEALPARVLCVLGLALQAGAATLDVQRFSRICAHALIAQLHTFLLLLFSMQWTMGLKTYQEVLPFQPPRLPLSRSL